MTGHDASMRRVEPVSREGDRTREKLARLREGLAETIVGRRCLPVAERLFDWSYDRSKTNGLAAAAKATIVVVQEELEKLLLLGRDPLEHAVAFELGYAKAWAICALRQVCTDSEAKRIELGLTGGAPLTICTGMTSYRANEAAYLITPFLGRVVNVSVIHRGKARVLEVPAFGCFRIIPDTIRTNGKPWRYWCEDCEPRKSQRLPRTRRAHRRVVNSL